METTIRQFQEEVRDILNQDTWFGDHGIDWLAEDTLDIEYEIKKHLGQTGIVAVVTTPELTYQGECKSVTRTANYEKTETEVHELPATLWTTHDEQGREVKIYHVQRGPDDFLWMLLPGWSPSEPWFVSPNIRFHETIEDNTFDILLTVENEAPVSLESSKTNGTTGTQDTSSVVLHEETVESVNKGFDATISLQIVENPTVNRGKPNKDAIATAIDVAHHAVYTLAGYDSGNFNNFNPSTIRQSTVGSAGNKLLQVDARFTSTPIL